MKHLSGEFSRSFRGIPKSPEECGYVSGAWIKIGFFVTDDDLRYQDEVHGSPVRAGGENARSPAHEVSQGLKLSKTGSVIGSVIN